MNAPRRVLIFQTAFLGDVVLTLPLAQTVRREFPDSSVSFVAIPAAASVLEAHPAIREVIAYDKKRTQRGLAAARALSKTLRDREFDVALVPHRSLRSALIVAAARIPRRIGFDTSAGRAFFTDRVAYRRDLHEIDRNLSLLGPLGVPAASSAMLPAIHPIPRDREAVDALVSAHQDRIPGFDAGAMVAVAPGSVWMTKRWPEAKFLALVQALMDSGLHIALIGGPEDRALCERIARSCQGLPLCAAGNLTPVQSAELIRRCRVLVSNDSAPAHLGTAVRTPVVAVFGATVPAFGFSPRGDQDIVIETAGLSCRPCSIHGGEKCPIKTFDCMERISPGTVHDAVIQRIRRPDPPVAG